MTIALSLGVLPRSRRRMSDTSVKDSFTMSCFKASRRFAAAGLAPLERPREARIKIRPLRYGRRMPFNSLACDAF